MERLTVEYEPVLESPSFVPHPVGMLRSIVNRGKEGNGSDG